MKRLFLSLTAAAAFAAGSFQAFQAPAQAQAAATPTPPPPPPSVTTSAPPSASASATPSTTQTATAGGVRGKATPAPPKDEDANRVGISGVWEVAIQEPNNVVYTHFKLDQKGTTLTGQYLDASGKKFPLTGSIDGKTVRVVVSLPNGSALVFNGTEDGGLDMVGTIDTSNDIIGFTAAYRPKYKWIDNLTPGAGGMGGSGVPYK